MPTLRVGMAPRMVWGAKSLAGRGAFGVVGGYNAAAMIDQPLKLIYIASTARSGSTVLAQMLGQIEWVFSLGELHRLWRDNLLKGYPCGCGEPVSRCEFWSAVLTEAFGSIDAIDVPAMMELRKRAGREMAKFSPAQLRAGAHTNDYAAVWRKLLGAVQHVSGASVLVDTTKRRSHGRLLCCLPETEVAVVHLVRDSRATSYSRRRGFTKTQAAPASGKPKNERLGLLACAADWKRTNAWAAQMRAAATAGITLQYEQFVAAPAESLRQIMALVQDGPVELPFLQGGRATVKPSHTLAGNPMRFEQGGVELKLDTRWQTEMPIFDKFVITQLTRRDMRRLGYAI